MAFAFFAKPYFIGKDPSVPTDSPYLFRGSSLIRGKQVADFLGAKYNPASGFEDDVCIYIKPRSLTHIHNGAYVDVVDGDYLVGLLKNRPEIKVIASLKSGYEYLKSRLKNRIILIPQHHCNFERAVRTRKKVTTGGYIGGPSSLANRINGEIEKQLNKIGLKYITCYNYRGRQDVIRFYKRIDFQIIGFFGCFRNDFPFTHPLKIINAASFGIPTLAEPKLGYGEFASNYLPAENMDSLLSGVVKLKNPSYYNLWAEKISKAAEYYHIGQIAEKYKQLTVPRIIR